MGVKLKKGQSESQATPTGMVEVRPQTAAAKVKPRTPPRLEESPPFLFTHHPEKYIVMEGRVIPELGKLKLQGGINGVEVHPKTAEILPQLAIDEAMNRGLVVIPHDVDGENTTYLRSPEGAPHAVLTKWDRTYSGSAQVDTDRKAYAAWCLSLIERGILPHPPVYVLERMIASTDRELEQLADQKGHERLQAILRRNREVLSKELTARLEAEPSLEASA